MASYKEIDGYLADLPLGPQKLIDIVTKIQSIHSKKHRTQQLLSKQRQSDDYLQHCAVKLDGKFYNLKDIWVDISYQRYLRLKKLYDHLGIKDVFTGLAIGFDPMLAGYVDFAVRPDGKVFVWDGFRRCILALLKGLVNIPANVYFHPEGMSDTKCRLKEATSFFHRNSAMEPMKTEEMFKAGIVAENPKYLKVKQVLIDCKLDVLKINQGEATLGGYSEFEKLVLTSPYGTNENPTGGEEYIVEASRLIQKAWGDGIGANVGGFMIAGLSYYLYKNEAAGNSLNGTSINFIDPETIEEKLENYAQKPNGTQSSVTKDRLHSKPKETVAWRIATKILNMEEAEATVFLGFNTDEASILGASNGI